MVKVKIIENPYVDRKDCDKYVGNIYEAFIDNRFEEGYCVNLLDDIWFIRKACCEEVDENEKTNCNKILLVEDGSIDLEIEEETLEKMGYKVIVYRQGANKP